jgi:hypothetical protein
MVCLLIVWTLLLYLDEKIENVCVNYSTHAWALQQGMDKWIVSGGGALLDAGHKRGLICTTGYLWCHNHLFCVRPGFTDETIFVLHVFGWGSLKLPKKLILVFEYQLIVGPVNPNYNSNSRLVLNPSFPPMVYECQTESSS